MFAEFTIPSIVGALVTLAALIYSIAKGVEIRREARTMPEDSQERKLLLTAGLFMLEPLGTLPIMLMLSYGIASGLDSMELRSLAVFTWVPLPWLGWSLVIWPWLMALRLRGWGGWRLFKLGVLGFLRGSVFIVVPVSVWIVQRILPDIEILAQLPMLWSLSMVIGFLGLLLSCVWVPQLSLVDAQAVAGLAKRAQVEPIGLERRAEP